MYRNRPFGATGMRVSPKVICSLVRADHIIRRMMRRACPALFIVLLATIALPQSKVQSASQRPLSLPDVVAFMSAGIQRPTVEALVQRGLDFAMTDSVAAGLKTCGATDDELQAMRPKQGAIQKEWLPAYEKIDR